MRAFVTLLFAWLIAFPALAGPINSYPVATPSGPETVIGTQSGVTVNMTAQSIAALSGGGPSAANNTALKALPTTVLTSAVRLGFAAAGDAPPLVYTLTHSMCSAADNGAQVAMNDGGCATANFPAGGADVREWGAKCDGSTDDVSAINAALLVSIAVRLPAATCKVSGTLNVTLNNQSLTGQGVGVSVLTSSSVSLPLVKIGMGLANFTLANFTVDRSTTATAGGNGIDVTNGVSSTGLISNVQAQNQWFGFALGPASYGQVAGSIAFSNFSDGFHFTNTIGSQNAQWVMMNDIAESNNGYGYNAVSTAATTMVFLPWVNIETYANGLGGVSIGSSGSGNFADVNILGGIFSTDNGDELYFNNVTEHVQVSSVYAELAGTATSGRGHAISASNTGNGIEVSGSVGDVNISGGTISANSQNGILSGAFRTQVTGVKALQNSQAASNTYSGISVQNTISGSTALVSGNVSGNLNTSTPQETGVGVFNGIGATVTGNDLCFNDTSGISIGSNFSSISAYGNTCALTETSGVAVITAGQTSVVVAHGLISTPNSIVVTPFASGGAAWIDTATSTHFTIHIPSVLGGNLSVNWIARFMSQ